MDRVQEINIPAKFKLGPFLYQAFFFETSKSIFSDDDVIKDVDADDPASVDEPSGDAQVFFGRFRIAGRVIVDFLFRQI